MRILRPRPLLSRPTVTVAIPCYNYGRYLPAAVSSALEQADVDVEVVIVDDCSTDGSQEVAARLAAADPRVSLVQHEVNQGHIATFNDGVSRGSGTYVVLMSADDMLAPGALARTVALMEHHPRVGLVYGHPQAFTQDSPEVAPGRLRSWSLYPGRQWLEISARRGKCFLFSPEAVMRREALEEVGLYDPRLPHSSDFDMWLRTALRWDVGRVNGPVQAHYRVHDANMHLTTFAGWLTDLRARRQTFELLVEERAADLGADDRDDLRRIGALARTALSREAVRRALAAKRDGAERQAEDYLSFALETDPAVQRRPEWSLAQRWRGSAGRRRAAWQFAGHVNLHLRWRRTRRWGT